MTDKKKPSSRSTKATPKIQKKIKNYTLTSVVGKGGMGEVYLAKHPTLNRQIILKQLKLRDKESKERFLLEAKVMLDFRHENIVQVYDHFKEGSATFIAMEYVKGKALNSVIEENETVPIPLALFILYQAALGLHHAHTKKVIHRDIKPHNILISINGEVKLTDFGIATRATRDTQGLTAPGTVMGTPAYMGPEQFSTSKDVTIQTDIYSLGIVFYEMITGVRPYKNEFSSDVIEAISKGRFVNASKYVKNMPLIVKKILRKTFNPDMNKRYKTLLPLVKQLKSYFKRYNVYELKDSVKRLISGDKNFENYPFFNHYQEQQSKTKRNLIIGSTIVLVTTLTVLFIYTNRYYEWFAAQKYGKVILQFRRANLDENNIFIGIDGKYEKAKFKKERIHNKIAIKTFETEVLNKVSRENEIFLKSIYQREKKKDKNGLVKNYVLSKKLNKRDKKQLLEIMDNTLYSVFSKVYYLKHGEHEFNIVAGSYKNMRREIILPISMQRNNINTHKGKLVIIPISKLWQQDVNVYFRFWNFIRPDELLFRFNDYSGIDVNGLKRKLAKEADFLKIYSNKRYIPLKFFLMRILNSRKRYYPFYSNKTYHFMVSQFKKNDILFETKKFKMDLRLDDRTIVAHIPLIPVPATIQISSNKKKLPIFLNGKNEGYVYAQTNKKEKTGEYEYKKYSQIKGAAKGKDNYIFVIKVPPAKYQLKIDTAEKKDMQLKSGSIVKLEVIKENGKYIFK